MGRKKKGVKKVCEQCGKGFEVYPSKATQKFCSRACKDLWMSESFSGENNSNWQGGKVRKNCEVCGKGFERDPSQADKARFCSLKCKGLWRSENIHGENHPDWKEKVRKNCEVCGKQFDVWPCMAIQKLCSHKCRKSWQHGKNNSNWQGGMTTLVCKQCGKDFEVAVSRAGKARFCSRKCVGLWNSENLCNENHWNWQGGKSFEPYGSDFDDKLKKTIRKRDNHLCAISGDLGNHVHHINYDKTDNRPENLITLSASYHGKTNTNRDLWQALLGPIVQSREGI